MHGTPIVSNDLRNTHDLRLSNWGPYSKRYMGISHIPDRASGLRFDLAVFPALYRRKVNVPNVNWETGYYPWEAAPDLSYFRFRHELIWKDQVYVDIDCCRLDDDAVLIAVTCVNNTDQPQQLALHYLAAVFFPPQRTNSKEVLRPYQIELPDGAVWIDALDYVTLDYHPDDLHSGLQYDGQIRGEVLAHGFVGGTGLGPHFGQHDHDHVVYHISVPKDMLDARLLLRCRVDYPQRVELKLSGLVDTLATVSSAHDGFGVVEVELGDLTAGEHELTITPQSRVSIALDGLALAEGSKAALVQFVPVEWNGTPQRLNTPDDTSLILRYEHIEPVYGLKWGFESTQVRQIITDDLDSFMSHRVHDHFTETLRDPDTRDNPQHYTNVFMRPIFLRPGETRTIFGLVCTGGEKQVRDRLANFDPGAADWDRVHVQHRQRTVDLTPDKTGAPYRFSQERMAATVLTNIVYPVRCKGTWIQHYTPGRWWDSLYTWDAGFIGLGLLELDLERAIDCLNAYVTEPGDADAAFIHHGTPLPVQHYLFQEIWNRTQSESLLTYFYPRLRQYYHFLAGHNPKSRTRMLKSNLLQTWDYFYNSGGWDDYPPQHFLTRKAPAMRPYVTPVVTTAHAIRAAKILRQMANALGEQEDIVRYDADITLFSSALQDLTWDAEAGYFSYLLHDVDGNPVDIMRHKASETNFNMGLDGATPLVAGICTDDQITSLTHKLMSSQHLWSRCGLSTVDQSAPYYRDDGYWNGAVWMPHQWFFWKTLLDLGRADEAHRIAQTGLDVWRAEVDASYLCFEHFIVQTGRGAGWHHFGGLSAPVLAWYGAYHRLGRLTTGFDTWINEIEFSPGFSGLNAQLVCTTQSGRSPVVIATLRAGEKHTATLEGQPLTVYERYPGILEIMLPYETTGGELKVAPRLT